MVGKAKNISNQRFGRLIALSIDMIKSSYGKIYWNCVCDCGKEKSVLGSSLRRGAIRSCGCLHLETARANGYKPKTHGLSQTRLHKIWEGMIQRCGNAKNHAYMRYGGRGVSVCTEWKMDFVSFFIWAMNNGYSDELSIDRIDVNGNYEPQNCRWSSPKEQSNNMRSNFHITYNDKTHTLTEWSEATGIKRSTLRRRIVELGWSIEKALNMV